jgi:urease accessory protein
MSGAGVRDSRAPREIGRRARLELVFSARGGRTVLAHCYAEPPLRIGRCFPEGRGVHVILASSAPGLFGGDAIEQTVVVEEGAVVRLSSQSALQLHPSTAALPAVVSSRYDMAAGGALSCEGHPLIPFARASLEQHIELRLAAGSRLSWSDAMMCGREGRGERWQFSSIAHELRLVRGDRLAYLERYRLEPTLTDTRGCWIGRDAAYFGTVVRAGCCDTPAVARQLHELVAGAGQVCGAADLVDDDLLIVRLAAADGVQFHRQRALLNAQLAPMIDPSL